MVGLPLFIFYDIRGAIMVKNCTKTAVVAILAIMAVGLGAQENGASVLIGGADVALSGVLPEVGSVAPDFLLVDTDLQEVTLASYEGKNKIISVVPSLDTRVCALSARKFNEHINELDNTVMINVSVDLPFAARRFCEAEGLEKIVALSAFRAPHFGHQYGLRIEEGAFEGLLARAVVVLDDSNTVIYSELVPDIGLEPNYEAILSAINE